MASNGKPIYDGLIARGFTPTQASVLAGNIQQESSFDPKAVNKGSDAHGLMQWRLDRKTGLDQYAADTGRDAGNIDTQLDYIVHEMQGPEAKNAAPFLQATDVKTANDAIKKYIRYGDAEAGKRLDYAMAFAGQPGDAPAAPAATDSGFVNPGFSGDISAPAPFAAPPPLSPDTMPPASPGAASDPNPNTSDDALLNSFLGGAAAPPTANPDDDFLKQFLTPGPNDHPAKVDPLAGTQQLFPGADALSAAFSSGVDAIDVVGHPLMDALVGIKANMNGRTKEQQWAIERGVQEQQPVASATGTVIGKVAPYLAVPAIGGVEGVGAKLLGMSGTMAERIAAGGLSSASIQAADTISRGGSLEDAGKSALEGGLIGGTAGTLGGKLIARTLGGAAIGGGETALQGGSPQDIERNALIGAGAGAGLHGGAVLGNKLLSGTPEVVAKLAKAAMDKYGIPVEAAQMSSNPLVKHAGDIVNKIPGMGGSAAKGKQIAAFNSALAKEMGETAETLTPDVMASARDRIGNQIEDIVSKRVPTVKGDNDLINDLAKIESDAGSTVEAAKLEPIKKQITNVLETFKNGDITGDQYLSLIKKGSVLSKAIDAGGDIGNAATDIKDALYGALQRSAPPDAVKDLTKARYQWKVMKTLENPAAKSPTGEISPANLMGPVVKNFGGKAYGQAGNMGELADIGQRLLKDPNSSQTAERGAVMLGMDKLLHSPVTAMAGLGALAVPGGLATLAANAPAIGVGAGLTRVAAAGLRSKALANKLIQNSLKTAPSTVASPISIAARSAVPLAADKKGPVIIRIQGGNRLLAPAP